MLQHAGIYILDDAVDDAMMLLHVVSYIVDDVSGKVVPDAVFHAACCGLRCIQDWRPRVN